MSDLTLNIQARVEEAQRQIGKLEKQISAIQKPVIQFQLPTFDQTVQGLKAVGTAAEITYKVVRAVPNKVGQTLQDLEDVANVVKKAFTTAGDGVSILSKATAGGILKGSWDAINQGAMRVSTTIASLGYEIFGVTQSVNVLKNAFDGFFNETVGRQIRLNETILRTKTALAATSDVAINGQRLTDPKAAMAALDQPIDATLQSIRRRSLDIAGTTSEAIIGIFQTVATQIGSFGGSLKDAEDLAITFSAALGTIGMSDPGMAMQEIRSILQGDITNDSILARSIGLTNKDIQKAKQSAGGLVDFLQKRLEPFVAGQEQASRNFAGVTSNIQEIQQEVARAFGAPTLEPLLNFLTEVYKRLSLVFDQITGIAETLGRIGSGAAQGIIGGLMGGQQMRNFSERGQIKFFDAAEKQAIEFFKYIQNEIDNLRPELNQISTEIGRAVEMAAKGLGGLAAGLASFKFAQFKILLSQLISIGQVLNNTVVPAVTSVLALYGKILSNDVVQYISEITVTMNTLEKIGIMPVVRILFMLQAAWVASIRTGIGWVQRAIQAVQAAIRAIVNGIATGIRSVGDFFTRVGQDIVTAVKGIGDFILNIVARIAAVIGMHLVTLGRYITRTYPQFAALGKVFIGAGNALKNLDMQILRVQLALDKMAEKMKQSMTVLRDSANTLAQRFQALGTIIGTWMVAQIQKLGGAIWGMIKGILIFQAQMLAIQAATAVVANAIGQYTRRQDQLNESQKAALAAERLVTVYKNIGESASVAAKAMRDYNKAIVEGRLSTVTTQIGETSAQLRQKLERRSRFDKEGSLGFLDNLKFMLLEDLPASLAAGRTPYALQLSFDQNEKRRNFRGALSAGIGDTRAEQLRLNREADMLSEKLQIFQDAQSADQANEQVAIFARERQDIEEVVKEMRLKVEKEIADVRFRTEREVVALNQQLREAQRSQERADLERSLSQQAQGMTSLQSESAEILNQFKLGLFDAQTEAQRRQFEITEKRIQLEKSVEEYKLAMEKQVADIRKRMNDYDQKVVDWKSKKAEEERQKNLKAALYETAVRTENYVLPQSDKEVNEFRQAVVGQKGSPRQALALLKAPGVLEELGVTPGMSPKSVTEALFNNPSYGRFLRNAAVQGDGYFQEMLNARLMSGGAPDGAGKYLFNLASEEVSRARDFQRKVPPVPALKGFGGFDTSAYAQQTRDLQSRVIDAEAKLGEAIASLTSEGNLKDTLFRYSQPEQYTGLPSLRELDNSLQEVIDKTKDFTKALQEGRTYLTTAEAAQGSWRSASRQRLEGFLESLFKPDGELSEKAAQVKRQWMDTVLETVLSGKLTQKDIDNVPLPPTDLLDKTLATKPEETRQVFQAILQGIFTALKKTLPAQIERQITLDLAQFRQQSLENILGIGRSIGADKTAMLSTFVDVAAGDDPRQKRALQIEFEISQARAAFLETERSHNAEAVKIFEQEMEARRRAATNLGEFEATLKQAAEAIGYAKAAAQSLVEGYKGLVKSFLTGGDLKEAMESMVRGFLDRILDPILEKAFAPMQEVLEKQIREVFNIKSPEDVIKDQYALIMEEQKTIFGTLVAPLERNSAALENLYSALTGTHTGMGGPDLPAEFVGGGKPRSMQVDSPARPAVPIPVIPASSSSSSSSPAALVESIFAGSTAVVDFQSIAVDVKKAYSEIDLLGDSLQKIPAATEQASNSTGQFFAGLAGLAAGALSIFGGINKMQEGGTQNTLLGLAGIFAGIGGLASGFGPGGGLAGLFRAEGGPVTANRPYIVGERGPELFMPGVTGNIIPNDALPFRAGAGGAAASDTPGTSPESGYGNPLAPSGSPSGWAGARLPFTKAGAAPGTYIPFSRESTSTSSIIERSNRETIEALASAGPLEVKVETQTINNVEYVTAEQHRKGMAQAASRGRELTLAALQNSVRSRRRVGLSS